MSVNTVSARTLSVESRMLSLTHGGPVGWDTALQAERWRVRFPVGITGIFHWHNSSGRIMAVESTQPLTEVSTRYIFWGVKAGGA